MARKIRKEQSGWGDGLADLIEAALLAAPNRAAAIEKLEAAEGHLERSDMGLYLWAARRQRGVLTGGDAGRELIDAADGHWAAEGIASPERFAAMLIPGLAAAGEALVDRSAARG